MALALGGLAAALSWKKAMRDPDSVDGALSAGAFSLLFLSHIVWKDYFLFLYFPLRELFAKLARPRAIGLGLAFLALVTFSSMDIVGAPFAARLDAGGIHLWAGVLIWATWLKT
ncbi:MAG: hypothetical protein EOP11_15485 [Proteobacteria bacterium]|nr:MAG: hypothetical protein EOP11_15485 [Pseudomonadota bacterium]